MKFLTIEDNENKINIMKEHFKEHELEIALSYNSGVSKLVCNKYDGLILDMSFPQFDDEPWKICRDNGIRVLSIMKRRKINIPTVIFSSDVTDIPEYENVKDYIVNDNYCIKDKVLNFIEICSLNTNRRSV